MIVGVLKGRGERLDVAVNVADDTDLHWTMVRVDTISVKGPFVIRPLSTEGYINAIVSIWPTQRVSETLQ